MKKLTILTTNDDGIESPSFIPFLRSLEQSACCDELRFVVPAEEHSWIAQAATPKKPVFVSEYPLHGTRGFSCSGTPADCVSLGVDNLFESRPDLVFSGINIGSNAGLAFYLSSGTVGAARQGFLSSIPSAAFSVKTPRPIFEAWGRHDLAFLQEHQADWDRIASVCVSIAERLIQGDAWEKVDLFSVNIPWEAELDSEIAVSELQRTHYMPLFVERAKGEYIHQPKGLQLSEPGRKPGEHLVFDREAISNGLVSVTPIHYELSPNNPEYLKRLSKSLKVS